MNLKTHKFLAFAAFCVLSPWLVFGDMREEELAVAANFAEAMLRDDILLGVFRGPDASPPVLPSGEHPLLVTGFLEAVIRHGLRRMDGEESLHGPCPRYVFRPGLPSVREGKPFEPLITPPGSRWILALSTNCTDLIRVSEEERSNPELAFLWDNIVCLFNDSRGMACLDWPDGCEYPKPAYAISVGEDVLRDIRLLRDCLLGHEKNEDEFKSRFREIGKRMTTPFGKHMHTQMETQVP